MDDDREWSTRDWIGPKVTLDAMSIMCDWGCVRYPNQYFQNGNNKFSLTKYNLISIWFEWIAVATKRRHCETHCPHSKCEVMDKNGKQTDFFASTSVWRLYNNFWALFFLMFWWSPLQMFFIYSALFRHISCDYAFPSSMVVQFAFGVCASECMYGGNVFSFCFCCCPKKTAYRQQPASKRNIQWK